MRFLHLSGPGVMPDEAFCPNCHVLLDDRGESRVCQLCHDDTRQPTRQRRVRHREDLDNLADLATGVGPLVHSSHEEGKAMQVGLAVEHLSHAVAHRAPCARFYLIQLYL
jgi:hypothetical protein